MKTPRIRRRLRDGAEGATRAPNAMNDVQTTLRAYYLTNLCLKPGTWVFLYISTTVISEAWKLKVHTTLKIAVQNCERAIVNPSHFRSVGHERKARD